jgi:hypothetical protein
VFARPDPDNPLTATLPELEDAEAVQIDSDGSVSVVAIDEPVQMVDVAKVLAVRGWISAPVAKPTGRSDLAWTRLINAAGLLPGITRLRDELRLLYAADQITNSPFGAQVDWVWNGTAFVPRL